MFQISVRSHFAKLDENKPKASKIKDIIKTRAEISGIENRKIIETNQ